MNKGRLFAIVLMAGWLLVVGGASAEEPSEKAPPEKALGLETPGVTRHGARLRLTRSTWDYLKLTLRDTFKKWDFKGGDGFNLLIDSGYDTNTHSAGPIRTTPFTQKYGSFFAKSRPNNSRTCGDWANCNRNERTCGRWCQNGGWTDCNAGGYELDSRSGWVQCRKPGYNTADMPLVDWRCRSNFNEYGFYIPASGSDSAGGGVCGSAPVSADFNQFQVCTDRYRYDTGSGKPTGSQCTGAPVSYVVGDFHYNARLFLFPNMRQESVSADPVDGWDPTLGGTVRRGPYTGYFGPYRSRIYDTDTDCQTQSPWCYNGGQCCNLWCLGCGSWAPCGTTTIQEVGCPAASTQTSFSWRSYVKMPPQSAAAYDPAWQYNETDGTYFRPGDDTSIYLNIYEMQIQSADRSSYRPRSCLRDKIYTGLVGGEPNYITESQKVHNCMRPKMYWYDDPLYPTESQWKQCDPFDTWNADGTLNPNNDDAKWLYPGNPSSGGYGSPGRCGRQRCTWGVCNNHPTAGVWAWAAGSRTANLNDIYSDDDGSGRGTGWYGLKLDYVDLNPASNRIDIQFTGKDVRIEMGAALDYQPFGSPWDTAFGTGRIRLQSLVVKAELYLYSVDDMSCDRNYPASCGGIWQGINDASSMSSGAINPDKLIVDARITNVSINPMNPWYSGTSSCLFEFPIVGGCVVTLSDVLNFSFVRDMIVPQVADAVKDALKGALSDITAVVPNLNTILGNPIDLGTVLVDTGIFLTGNPNDYQLMNPPAPYPRKWPVNIAEGPTTTRRLVDMQMSVGFKPLAFRPPGANGVMDIDNNYPPLATSIYGVPELWRASTKRSGYPDCPNSVSGDTCPAGVFTPGPGCSAPAHWALKLDSGQHDDFEYCRGRPNSTADAWYYDPKTNNRTYLEQGQIVPHFWKGPIPEDKKPPSWCTIASPSMLLAGAGPSDLSTLYPQTRWLSFDNTLDNPPATSGLWDTGRNTIGTWDQMPAFSVLKQGTTSFDGNQGTLDSAAIPYDFSMHIHQRTFVQFMQTILSSGLGCLEFSAKDPDGGDSPWKSLLATDRFAAFLPEVQILFPNSYVKVRIMPTKTPHIRVGMGNLSFTPESRIQDPVKGALPITNQPYTISAALPDLQVQILVEDPNTGTDVSILTFNWNTVVGFYAKAVRQCYHLDPLATDPECTSPFTNVRTVSGYYELFFDINGQDIVSGKKTGNNQLGSAWENNGRDGFSAGRFTQADFVCPECTPSIPTGRAMFEVTQSYCDFSDRCDMLGLAQSIPTILSSTIQAFLASRLSFYNLTIDFLYVGPDGPDDDGIGSPKAYPFNHIDGDYLGIYARFLGNLNVFGLLEAAGDLAPKSTGNLEPQAIIDGFQNMQFVNSSTPEFPVTIRAVPLKGDPNPVVSYTYSIDDGLWHTPVDWETLTMPRLTEGEHKLTIRTLQDSVHGAAANLTPTNLKFIVDTIAPDVKIPPSKKGIFGATATITATDLQTPAERLNIEYAIDDGDWQEADDLEVSLSHLRGGKHVLRARATDLAGNTGEAARVVVIDADGRWGCQSSSGGDAVLIWLTLLLVAYSGRRAVRRK